MTLIHVNQLQKVMIFRRLLIVHSALCIVRSFFIIASMEKDCGFFLLKPIFKTQKLPSPIPIHNANHSYCKGRFWLRDCGDSWPLDSLCAEMCFSQATLPCVHSVVWYGNITNPFGHTKLSFGFWCLWKDVFCWHRECKPKQTNQKKTKQNTKTKSLDLEIIFLFYINTIIKTRY